MRSVRVLREADFVSFWSETFSILKKKKRFLVIIHCLLPPFIFALSHKKFCLDPESNNIDFGLENPNIQLLMDCSHLFENILWRMEKEMEEHKPSPFTWSYENAIAYTFSFIWLNLKSATERWMKCFQNRKCYNQFQ